MVPRLTLRQLWLGLAIVLPGLTSLLAPLSTVDLAWQLRAGEAILSGGGIPRVDSYTFTLAGQAWTDQQWAAQAVLALVYQVGGWTGLVLLRALLIGASWACLLLAIRWTAPNLSPRLASALAIAAFLVAAPALALRPQLLAVLLFCLTLALIAGRRAHPRLLWAIPLVVVAWANVHGSFVLALGLIGLAWLEDLPLDRAAAVRTRAVVAVSALATLVNPFGPWVYAYVIGLTLNRELGARVSEWQPPSIGTGTGLLFYLSLVAVALTLLRLRRLPSPPAALGLLAFALLGVATARAVAWWPAYAVVSVAGLLGTEDAVSRPAALKLRPRPATTANGSVLVLLVVLAIPLLPIWRPSDPDLGLAAPKGLLAQAPPVITRELRAIARPGDRIWNPQPWGSWLELAIPNVPVAFDSRIEVVPASLWADHDAVASGQPGWEAVLDRWGATIVVAAHDALPLRVALGNSLAWQQAVDDADGVIFVRADRGQRTAGSDGPMAAAAAAPSAASSAAASLASARSGGP
jgi:hypothetical protein